LGRSIKLIAILALLVFLATAPQAQASYSGYNGRLAIVRGSSPGQAIHTVNPDGSGETFLTNGWDPAWSPDGSKLAFVRSDGLYLANADGTGVAAVVPGERLGQPAWKPDGSQLVYMRFGLYIPDYGGDYVEPNEIRRVNPNGSGDTLIRRAFYIAQPTWSPEEAGGSIVFQQPPADNASGTDRELWLIDSNGSNLAPLVTSFDENTGPEWAPHGGRLLFDRWSYSAPRERSGLATASPDGSNITIINNTLVRRRMPAPSWSPDGTKIALTTAARHLYLIDATGTGATRITTHDDVIDVDWQPLPANSYPRPAGASPLEMYLVPTFERCTTPDRQHGPPLSYESCSAPATSGEVTLGGPDVNGTPPRGRGLVRYTVVVGNPSTPQVDEADVQITVEVSHVLDRQTMSDYTGELRTHATLRLTDRLNPSYPGGSAQGVVAGTMVDITLGATVPCTATAEPSVGATCNLVTSADAITPGAAPEGKRSVWQLGPLEVDDGGADGDADTLGDNTRFMTQGVFVP
jgi:Tol biopolymer transport system component